MCGIVVSLTNKPGADLPQRDAIAAACECMARRGPDAQGIWQGQGVTLGHRRLAILDLDVRSNQPMVSADGRYAIVFNGEIYNFRELRRQCEEAGKTFLTSSDTEVLLVLFASEGAAMLSRLRGMFAFAIWDTQSCELFVARDPYGIKPLYYARTRDGIIFASQVKALLASGLISIEREAAGLVGFYLWGSVPEPWTMYRGVFAVPAGHWIRIHNGFVDPPVCWHDIRDHWQKQGAPLSTEELQDLVSQSMTATMRAHLVADVPLSVFLSGGIDSSVLAGLASSLGAQVEGITIGFKEFSHSPNDEVPVAAAIAAHLGIPHFIRWVSRTEFEQDIPRIFDAMDQPSIDGVNTWFASKAAAERGYKVVLSGVGGDELFCGYSSFKYIPRLAALGRLMDTIPGARSLIRQPSNWLAELSSRPKLSGIPAILATLEGAYFLSRCLFLPEELAALMGPDMARHGLARLGGEPPGMLRADMTDDIAAVSLLESVHYLRNQLLRDSDWASMGHSLELRTPLIDAELLGTLGPYLSKFDNGAGKMMLARSLGNALPNLALNRAKTGFSVPMQQWLRQSDRHRGNGLLPMRAPRVPWARLWARNVVQCMA